MTDRLEELKKIAREQAINKSYSPYSKFSVGVALEIETESRERHVVGGCNIENASYGLTNCAERTAIFSAVSDYGKIKIITVVIYTPTEKLTFPCGACRQVINEFGPEAEIILTCDSEEIEETTLSKLLPGAFGPDNLDK